MNERQRRILIVIAVITAAMMLCPPLYSLEMWAEHGEGQFHYDWIFNVGTYSRVEVGVLIAQYLAVWVIGGIAYLLYADKK